MIIGNFVEYKGFTGSIEYTEGDLCPHHGHILNIHDNVTYSAKDIITLNTEFHDVVDAYISVCNDVDKVMEVLVGDELPQKQK